MSMHYVLGFMVTLDVSSRSEYALCTWVHDHDGHQQYE